jgi:tetratricopeptide (TPR) repeat protein
MPARSLPTGEEIERLNERLRREPGSPAFVELGDAYLALSRPRDAIEVGARGLRANPNSVEGRMMVSRAFAMLHKWKEAQAELLKVVKADRRNREGFRLLGEVLMRRADYDRALPVLQHAQNLDPADAAVLAMLKRAREGRPLDPPAGIPAPRSPAGAGGASPRRARASRPPPPPRSRGAARFDDDDDPTKVADSLGAVGLRNDTTEADSIPSADTLARMELERVAVKGEKQAPRELGVRLSDNRGNEQAQFRVEHHTPPPPEDPFAPLGGEPIRQRLPLEPGDKTGQLADPSLRRQNKPVAPQEPVRPRVLQAGVKQDRGHAREALKTSAAVGEDYLNSLLTNGLLDVPNVRVPPQDYHVVPDKVWGRSSARTFIGLFVLLFLGVGGATGYFIWDKKKRDEAVAASIAKAREAIQPGTYIGLKGALEEVLGALKRDEGNAYATAVFAQIAGMDLLLYGEPSVDAIERAIASADRSIDEDDKGAAELAIGRIAKDLAVLDGIEDDDEAMQRLTEIRAALAKWTEKRPDDLTLRWLEGVAADKAGDRDAARAAYDAADAGGDGLAAARIARANMLLDDGDLDAAFGLYDRLLDDVPGHPWGYIGRSLARSERSIEAVEAVDDLNVGLSDPAGAKVEAWKVLALATTHLQLEDYDAFAKNLTTAVGIKEPRYLARVALANLDLGKVKVALEIRGRIKWASASPQTHPVVATLDAELFLATGLPAVALSNLESVPGLGAHRARGRALFDTGKYEDALAELEAATKIAPDDREAVMWREASRYLADRKQRKDAEAELDKIARAAKAKDVKTVLGLALLRGGEMRAGRERLDQSVTDLTDEYPNPLAYRANVELGRMELDEDDLQSAEKRAKAALEQNEGYLPAHGLMGRVLVRAGDPNGALEHLSGVISEGIATASDELAFAEALVATGAASEEDKAQARQALERARTKGASSDEIGRVAEMIDPDAEGSKRRR